MKTFLDDFPSMMDDDPPVEVVERKLSLREQKKLAESDRSRRAQMRIQRLEEELIEDSLINMVGAAKFTAVDPDAGGPPPEWVEEYGKDEADRLFRAASMALMNGKEAPVGLRLSEKMVSGIMAQRSKRDDTASNLNVRVITIPAPETCYPELEIRDDDEA